MLSPDADQDFKVEGACEFSLGGGAPGIGKRQHPQT